VGRTQSSETSTVKNNKLTVSLERCPAVGDETLAAEE
jgi:hypothetical protein